MGQIDTQLIFRSDGTIESVKIRELLIDSGIPYVEYKSERGRGIPSVEHTGTRYFTHHGILSIVFALTPDVEKLRALYC